MEKKCEIIKKEIKQLFQIRNQLFQLNKLSTICE